MTGATMELPNWLDTAARNHSHKLALEFGEARWTFSELRRQVNAAASTLDHSMPERRGRIGILSTNRPGYVFAVHAATCLGIPFVPLNWRQSPAELAWQFQDAEITLLIADEHHEAISETVRTNFGIVAIPIAEFEREPKAIPLSPRSTGEWGWAARVHLNTEAAILYTSGTSGRPKGAILTYGNLWYSAIASALHIGHHADDIWLATMPLFHIGGLSILFRSVIGGTPVILHDRFDPERTLRSIDDGATLASLAPTMLDRMVEERGDRPWPSHLRCVLLGGSATPARLLDTSQRLTIPVAPTYGLTETTSQATTLLPHQVSDRPGSSGLPLPLTELRVGTTRGQASPGELGEIEVRGPTLFSGYLGDPRKRVQDAWFATGDVGFLDDDGYLYVIDRRDDLIVSGGENIYPAEIERVLRTHPLVADAGVVGVPHETWGARPIAAVIWGGDAETSESKLRRHCAGRLSRFKIPDRFVLVDVLPRTPSGKLLRRALADQIAANPGQPAAKAPSPGSTGLGEESGLGGEGRAR